MLIIRTPFFISSSFILLNIHPSTSSITTTNIYNQYFSIKTNQTTKFHRTISGKASQIGKKCAVIDISPKWLVLLSNYQSTKIPPSAMDNIFHIYRIKDSPLQYTIYCILYHFIIYMLYIYSHERGISW